MVYIDKIILVMLMRKISLCMIVRDYWLGDINKAIDYNEKAGKIKENDETYLKNKEIYLNEMKKQS